MNADAADEGTDDGADGQCATCEAIRRVGIEPHQDATVPAEVGGWAEWAMGFRGLVTRLGEGPTAVLVVSQPDTNDRYVQGLVGHGSARVQASSNRYLVAGSRLSPDQEEALAYVGWQPPRPDGEDEDHPANWTYSLFEREWGPVAGLTVYTIMSVFEFSEDKAVLVDTFGADHPCRECSGWWLDESGSDA